jgi:nitroreductase
MSTETTPSGKEEVVPATLNPTSPRKNLSRRKVIALAGTGTLILVAGGGVWCAVDQGVFSTGQGSAYQPWDEWRTPTRGPLNLVRAAILAANPHHSQPWLFHVTQTQIDLFSDRRRNLGTVDPFLIEMHIGLGCALGNLLLAAAANGYTTQVTLSPDASDETLVARFGLAPGSAPVSALYNVIPLRHTNRYPYDTGRPVTTATLGTLSALGDDPDVRVFWFASAEKRKLVGNLLVDDAHAFVADKAQDAVDTGTWWRETWQDIQQHRDGITLDAAGLPDLTRALGKMLPSFSVEQQDSSFLQNTAEQVKTAGVFGLLAIHNRQDRTQQLRAGRLWERMHLWVTKEGLAMQPLNQSTERASREIVLGITPHFGDALHSLVGDAAWQTILTFRTGYSTHEGLRSPRRAVNDVVKP